MSRIVEYWADFTVRWPRTGRVTTLRQRLPLGAPGLFLGAQRVSASERANLVAKLGLGQRVQPVALVLHSPEPESEPITVYDTRKQEAA